jgi:type IV secretory pathway TraG/TraD family ATPase VirD4
LPQPAGASEEVVLTATKILWGQVLVVFTIVLVTPWTATQWTAWRLGYAGADKTLAGVANFLSDPTREIEKTLKAMMATRHLGDRPHPVCLRLRASSSTNPTTNAPECCRRP